VIIVWFFSSLFWKAAVKKNTKQLLQKRRSEKELFQKENTNS